MIRGGAEGEARDNQSSCAAGQPAQWLLSQAVASSTGPVRVTAPVAAPGHRSPARAATDRSDRWMKRAAVQAGAVLAGSALLFGIPRPIHLEAPGARAGVETLIATSALVGAALLVASFRQGRRRADVLLLTALAAAGLTDFVFSALPALTGTEVFSLGSGFQVVCEALGAVAFLAAAFTPAGRLSGAGFRPLRAAGAVAAATIGLATATDLIAGTPALGGISSSIGITAAEAHPAVLTGAVFSSALLLIAGAAFCSRPERYSRVLGGASFLLAAAGLQYVVLPAVAPDWVTAREGLRLAAYGLLLMAAVGRFAQTRRAIAAATLAIERERIARELHDGLAQDLAFIALQGQRLSSELGSEHPLALAARRAVAASRGVIVDLAASGAATLNAALRQVANEVAARFGIEVDVRIPIDDGEDPAEVGAKQREDVVRIAREAIVNAARHGNAQHVGLLLDCAGDKVRLRISDDGHGMSQDKLSGRGGYGRQMMRARAAALGGHLVTRPSAQGGVEVEVTFPSRRVGAR